MEEQVESWAERWNRPEERQELVRMIVELSSTGAAKRLGCCRRTIVRAIKKHHLRPLIDALRGAPARSTIKTWRSREQVVEAIVAARGNLRRALRLLGLASRDKLYLRIRREGLEDLVDRLRASRGCA